MRPARTLPVPLLALVAGLVGARGHAQEPEAAALRALVPVGAGERSPGGVLAVLRRGEPTFVHAFGQADLEAGRAVTTETCFYLASVTKAFTAACVMHAAEAGKLELTASIARYTPGLPEACGVVTLAQLLHHRSGIDDVYDLTIGLDLGVGAIGSNAAAVELLKRVARPDFTPGARFCYSNSGYVLLAEALRGATGRTLPQYAREQVFGPLGMASARFLGEAEGVRPSARGYGPAENGGWRALELPIGLVGPGGMWATIDDLARWEQAMTSGSWGSAALRERLITPPALGPRESLHPVFGPYAAGAMVGEERGLRVVRMAGEAFGFGAEILRYPGEELTVIVLRNGDLGLDDLAEEAAAIALGDALRAGEPVEARAAASGAVELARFGRFWREEDTGILWVLTLRPERMVVASLGDWKCELVVAGPDRLAARRTRVPVDLVFEPATGPAELLRVLAGGVEVTTCRPHAPTAPSDPEEYAGEYALAGLETPLRVEARGGALVIVQEHVLAPGPPFVLPPFVPLGEDLFACDAGAQLQFRRDAEGHVSGVRLDLNRARGLELERL